MSSSSPVLPPAATFSHLRAREETTRYHVHIGQYSRIEQKVQPGECVDSVFRAGGRKWKLSYYPNGRYEWEAGQVSTKLVLMEELFSFNRPAMAKYQVSILGGNEEPAHSCTVGPRKYSASTHRFSSFGEVDVVATVEDQRSALRLREDGNLVVRCDVTVLKVDTESRIRQYLRQLLK